MANEELQKTKQNNHKRNTADLVVECLVNEGVEVVFGIPGEENIPLLEAIERNGNIRFVLTRHEQGAGFMAATYAHITGKPGVCLATLGPGALNLTLPVAQANASTTPLVAICAQGNVSRLYKESHQIIDLVSLFQPITQWSSMMLAPSTAPEMVRKAFSIAQRKRPGATCLVIPEDISEMSVPENAKPLPLPRPLHILPAPDTIDEAAKIISQAKTPIILAGNGVARSHAQEQLRAFAEQLNVPVATTFEGKGVFPDNHPNALGVVGFMHRDYENFAFDTADLIIAVGFSIQQFDPKKINPNIDKTIIHINTFVEDTDAHYPTALNIMADIGQTLKTLTNVLKDRNITFDVTHPKIRQMITDELRSFENDNSIPMKPQRVVYDTRRAVPEGTKVLVDTGALKMWMARLYPTMHPNTCIIDNSLSTMAWTLPGAVGASFIKDNSGKINTKPVLAVMGDGSFMMNVQEIETAVRVGSRMVVLVWEDNAYGLIKWKMDLHAGEHEYVDFTNPNVPKLAESFGARGHVVQKPEDLYNMLKEALEQESGVDVIACPVDYSENMKLIEKLGDIDFGN
ncbi:MULTISPECIES: acetolactate synthase large subunit [Gardnerella]|jgi:acetolactate synthase|uniref:Acetolactate synthase large subunit n=3 Tax=Gardnerella vaginalis TaxID=2702 RepID=A0ABD4ZCT2_GARVA|nr:acetolactate synthase large subunit [Gardnerella vaginalis]CQB86550.1 Acetolactate synthase%2C catabolic [Chlamydia trachomatis]ADP38978.1 thiamine pyrophosphate enzyme, N-terminal TPP binding domain protein [Gardnerella vaginalis ATCC 14019]EIK74947.1 acetolactate synthase [Gardnerella vaginalis 75712]EPI53785.1 acetolactate synthase [Gardnerella vaginalis JCP7672]KOS08725.1 acetolactate synthase [Gardnerella vaginalis]